MQQKKRKYTSTDVSFVYRTIQIRLTMSSFYAKYNQLLTRRPLLTNMVSTGFLFGTGDYLAQKIAISKSEHGKNYDLTRTLRAVIYGGIVFAPLGDKWYKILAKVKMPYLSHSKMANTIARVGLDQAVFAPFIGIPMYYSIMTMMEGGDGKAIETKMRKNWWHTLQTNWLVWPTVQAVNFGFVPVQLRLLVVNVVSIGWNCYLLMVMNDSEKHLVEGVCEEQVLI